jgi:hypothetical protein
MKLGKGTDFPEFPPAQSFLSHMCSPTGCWGGLQMGGGVGVGMEMKGEEGGKGGEGGDECGKEEGGADSSAHPFNLEFKGEDFEVDAVAMVYDDGLEGGGMEDVDLSRSTLFAASPLEREAYAREGVKQMQMFPLGPEICSENQKNKSSIHRKFNRALTFFCFKNLSTVLRSVLKRLFFIDTEAILGH